MRQQWQYARGNLIMDGTNGLDQFAERNNAIPQELKDRKQWTTWWFQNRDDKMFAGKSNDPTTWRTFDQVKNSPKIAFVIGDRGQYVGVDLDDCYIDGKFNAFASEILKPFKGISYAEISPSGDGVKLLIHGQKPDWAVCTYGKPLILECYGHNRFWCITGQVLEGHDEIGDDQGQVEWLCSNWLQNAQNSPPERSEPVSSVVSRSSAWDRAVAYAEATPAGLADGGGRDNAAFSLAGNLMAIVDDSGAGLSDGEVLALLKSWDARNIDPLGERVLSQKVRSARQSPTPREPKAPEPSDSRAMMLYTPAPIDLPVTPPEPWEIPPTDEERRLWGDQEPPKIVNLARYRPPAQRPYIIEGIWPVGGAMVISAADKTMKTSLTAMALFDIVVGRKFLRRFDIGQNPNDENGQWRVLFLSKESTNDRLSELFQYLKWDYAQELLQVEIAEQQRQPIADRQLVSIGTDWTPGDPSEDLDGEPWEPWAEDLNADGNAPQIDDYRRIPAVDRSQAERLREIRERLDCDIDGRFISCDESKIRISKQFLEKGDEYQKFRHFITRRRVDIVVIDPEYLTFEGERVDADAIGHLYQAVNVCCKNYGVTLAIVAHNKKRNHEYRQIGTFPDLSDTAFAALGRFRRAWININRETEYQHDGRHKLLIAYGNSGGDSGRLAVELLERVDLPCFNTWFENEPWFRLGTVETGAEYDQRQKDQGSTKQQAKASKATNRLTAVRDLIRSATKPMSRYKVREQLRKQGEKIGEATVHSLLQDLSASGDIQEVTRGELTLYASPKWVAIEQTGDG
jgi:hypothetical protein